MATTHNQPQGRTAPTSTPSFMDTRELYRQKYEAQLREWDAKVEEMKARADKLGAQAQLDMRPHLDTARAKYEAARNRLSQIGEAAEDTWEDMKKNAENAWNDFKAAAEGAYDALRGCGSKDRAS